LINLDVLLSQGDLKVLKEKRKSHCLLERAKHSSTQQARNDSA